MAVIRLRDLDDGYTVTICRHCGHPAGQHLLAGGCRLCSDCPGWEESGQVWWTDRMTLAAETAHARSTDG